MHMKLLPILFLAALVAGCAAPTRQWVKSGATAEDLHLDQDECAARGSSFDFAFDDRDTGRPGVVESSDAGSRRAGSARGDVYRQCMENRGWRRERGGTAPQ
jgi:hypothetical protein